MATPQTFPTLEQCKDRPLYGSFRVNTNKQIIGFTRRVCFPMGSYGSPTLKYTVCLGLGVAIEPMKQYSGLHGGTLSLPSFKAAKDLNHFATGPHPSTGLEHQAIEGDPGQD